MSRFGTPLMPQTSNIRLVNRTNAIQNNFQNNFQNNHPNNQLRPNVNQYANNRPIVYNNNNNPNTVRPLMQLQHNPQIIYGGNNSKQQRRSFCSSCNLWLNESYDEHQHSDKHKHLKNLPKVKIESVEDNKKIRKKRKNIQNFNQPQNYQHQSQNQKQNHQNQNQKVNKNPVIKTPLPPQPKKEKEEVKDKNNNRGLEVLIPVNGVFCTLCESFFPKTTKAEVDHCATREHCEAYEKFRNQIIKDLETPSDAVDDSSPNKKIAKIENKVINESNENDKLSSPSTSNFNQPKKSTPDNIVEFEETASSELQCPEVSLDFPEEDEFEESAELDRVQECLDNEDIDELDEDESDYKQGNMFRT